MKAKNSFTGGIEQDVALSRRKPDTMYSASNFQLTTSEGLSSGSLVNSNGTTIAFTLPNLAEMTLTDVASTVIPAQAELKIIGSTVSLDELIIISTKETSDTPVGYGQIWKCKFDELTGAIIGLTGSGELDPAIHLFYNQKLNLSTRYRVGRIIALKETPTKHRIYWTDNYNPVRVFNLAVEEPLNTSLENIDLFPQVKHVQPTITEVTAGSLPTGTKIQFSYRLADENGAVSVAAPPSAMTSLVSGTTSPSVFGDFEGGVEDLNDKSVTYDLIGLDTDYTIIEHLAIVYDISGPRVYMFSSQNVPAGGKLSVTCSSVVDATEVPLTDYSLISLGFTKAKDIEVQGNRLVAANISTTQFDVDFDTRAYRFNVGNKALLKDETDSLLDITLSGPSPTYSSVNENHDAINRYNQESNLTWADTANKYMYQEGGTVIGGSGPNVSYEFVTQDIPGNFIPGLTTAGDHVSSSKFATSASPLTTGVLEADGTDKGVAIAGEWNSMASNWAHNNYAGGARGEVYRYAMVIYDKLGSPSFAKWIGDIRFPDVEDGFPLQTMSGSFPILHNIGIKFTVDISSIADTVSGYSIVRVNRDEADRTKLGTGMYMLFDSKEELDRGSLLHTYNAAGTGETLSEDNPYRTSNQMNLFGIDDHDTMHISDKPGMFQHHGPTSSSVIQEQKKFGYLMGPIAQLNPIAHKTLDYIETLGYYESKAVNYMNDNTASKTDRSFGFYYKVGAPHVNPHYKERYEIEATEVLDPGEYIFTGVGIATDSQGKGIMNATAGRYDGVSSSRKQLPLGTGSKMLAVKLATTPTLPNRTQETVWGITDQDDPRILLTWKGITFDGPTTLGGTTLTWSGQTSVQDVYFKEVGYRRYLANQYGGNSFISRSQNEYISCGHYQVVEGVTAAASSLTFDVFGGDTFVNYYDDEKAEQYWAESQNYKNIYKPTSPNKQSLAFAFPVESPVNTDYRIGKHWASSRDASDMGGYISNELNLAALWTNPNDAQKKLFAKDFQSSFNESHPHLLWASDIKINGELRDNWRVFKLASKREVDGIYGPINRITSFKDNLTFFQDTAVGVASLDERSVISDQSGQSLVLGVGGVFPQYKYLSTSIGTTQQFSVVASETALYFFDSRTRKFMSVTGNLNSISDLVGMSSFFAENIKGNALTLDQTVAETPAGIHGTFDIRHNRVLFTVLGTLGAKSYTEFLDASTGLYTFPAGEFIDYNGAVYFMLSAHSGTDPDIPTLSQLQSGTQGAIPAVRKDRAFTFAFNEMIGKIENFYDFHPGMYVEYGRRLLSVSPFNEAKMFEHNVGIKGLYYDVVNSTCKLHIIFNAESNLTKVFNNIEYFSELQDSNKLDIFNETFDRIRFYNDYQDTGVIDLSVEGNIKRRMRKWRLQIPRDKDVTLSRMRNPWLHCEIEFDNNLDKRLVVHDIIYAFTPGNN